MLGPWSVVIITNYMHKVQAEQPKPISDHADAAKDSLLRIVRLLEAGNSPEDLGPQVILIGRMMARKT